MKAFEQMSADSWGGKANAMRIARDKAAAVIRKLLFPLRRFIIEPPFEKLIDRSMDIRHSNLEITFKDERAPFYSHSSCHAL
jgi:hypothetical protein